MTEIVGVTVQSRKRYLIEMVRKHMAGWQHIWMTSEHDSPSITKGRYIASKEFFDWLSNGGEIEDAAKYLDEREVHWRKQYDDAHRLTFAAQLTQMKERGEDVTGFEHGIIAGFTTSADEQRMLRFLQGQYQSSVVGVDHLRRFLRDDYVSGKTNQPPPAAVRRAVTQDEDFEDENEEPDERGL